MMQNDGYPPGITCLLRDVPGSEGPCVTPDGRIFMVGPNEGRVVEVFKDGTSRDLANTGGIPAGLQLDRDGSLLVADMKLGILRVTMDGLVHEVVREFNGRPIRGCNDLYFDSGGNLYFTAPAGSSFEDRCGELFCRLASGEVRLLDEGFAFSNGLAVSADDRILVVAETWTKQLHAYELPEPGVAAGKRLFATLSGDHFGGPDGIDFDVAGNLISTNWGAGALEVFGPDGSLRRRIELPFQKPSNIHFDGPGSRNLLVTEHDTNGLWRFDYAAPGQKQYGWKTINN
jgi:gluconolactonase